MASTTTPRTGIPDEEMGRLLALIKDSDSVELKATVQESEYRSAIVALEMDPLEAQIRQIYFFDTRDLAVSESGVVVRARRVQGKGDESVVKLRPVVPVATKCMPAEIVQISAEVGAFLAESGVDISGQQQTKTRKALEHFAGVARGQEA